jgi:hypothetical protein
MKPLVIEGTVEAVDIDIEDGGAARIATVSPDATGDKDVSGIFIRVQSWDEEFAIGKTDVPSHPDFEKLFGTVCDHRSQLIGKKRVRVTIEVLD